MSLRLLSGCAVLGLAAFGAAAARADDYSAALPSISPVAGYVEGHGAWESGWSTHYDPSADGAGAWTDTQIEGSARGAVLFGANWGVQGDAWSEFEVGSGGMDGGVSGHLTWHSTDGGAMLACSARSVRAAGKRAGSAQVASRRC